MTIIKKILLVFSIAGIMVVMAGCAYNNSINNHRLNKTEQYKLGVKADKLEGLPAISIKKQLSSARTNKKIQGVKNGK